MTNVVYFVSAPSKRVKIGTTRDMATRMQNLRGTSPEPLEVLLIIEGGLETEAYLHQRFGHLRTHSEWFLDCDELREFVELLRRRGRSVLPHLGDEEDLRTARKRQSLAARAIVEEMARHVRLLGEPATAVADQTTIAARATGLSRHVVERLRWKKIGRVTADQADAVRAAVHRAKTLQAWRLDEELRILKIKQPDRAGLLDRPLAEPGKE